MEVRFPIEKLVSCQTATIIPQEAENVITGLAVCCWDTELCLWGRSFIRRLINLIINVAKSYSYIFPSQNQLEKGAGIAQWLEHRTRDWKVAGSNPCWNGGRIFFSRVDFLCWLLFRYPFHPRVTAVARKKSRSFCQKCRWQVTAKHAYTLRMWILLNRASALVTTCP